MAGKLSQGSISLNMVMYWRGSALMIIFLLVDCEALEGTISIAQGTFTGGETATCHFSNYSRGNGTLL